MLVEISTVLRGFSKRVYWKSTQHLLQFYIVANTRLYSLNWLLDVPLSVKCFMDIETFRKLFARNDFFSRFHQLRASVISSLFRSSKTVRNLAFSIRQMHSEFDRFPISEN